METKKDTKETKVADKGQETVCQTIRNEGVKKNKDRAELAKKVFDKQMALGNKKNIKGTPLTLDMCANLVDGVFTCVTKKRGAKVWQNYEVVETETPAEFRLVLKKVQN